ncbi:hypothetical protein NW762_013941 [Fusarium torreyae]|uniref:Xylanolytic transcriptional activator regulatory domain-containing protein n=1 Tax=Fusarium torreyae TaxID=1237075 RepID=A0A9W8RL68_9HYPO|nr:hypothetical protein NW762_013941 [Fusarium torreyae]
MSKTQEQMQRGAVGSSLMDVDMVNTVSQQQDLSNEVSSDCSTSSSALLRPENFDYYIRLIENNLGTASTDPIRKPQEKSLTDFVGVDQIRQAIEHRIVGSQDGALAAFDMETWIAVLQLWDEEVGLQYPLLNIHQLVHEIDAAKKVASSPKTSASSTHQHTADVAFLVLAILSCTKDASAVEVADLVIQEIHGATLVKVHTGQIDRGPLVLLILAAVYSFLVDREVLAWRTTGTVLRLLQELDCQDNSHDVDIDDKLFWTAYTLDRRWSFGTGLPFAILDTDITRKCKLDDGSLSSAYLNQMVSYCNIASDVRKSLFNLSPSVASSTSTRDFLEFRVLQWQQNLPLRLRFQGPSDMFDPSKETRGEYKLRLMLYLRASQMRIVIHRKFATIFESDTLDPSTTRDMIEVAQGTIHVLLSIARQTDIYYAQHKNFNHFLETALSLLLLILCSPEASQHPSCLRDVLMAMEFIGQLAKKSPISEKLKKRLQGIQQLIVEANGQSWGPSHFHTITRNATMREGSPQRNDTALTTHSESSESAVQPQQSEQNQVLTNTFSTGPALHQLSPQKTRSCAALDTQAETIVPLPAASDPKRSKSVWYTYEGPSNHFVTTNQSDRFSAQEVVSERTLGPEKTWPLSYADTSSSHEMDLTSDDLAIFRSADMAEILKDYDSFLF